jgi:hypothetical protein
MEKEKLILFDFSGTLSIEAVNFGQEETLYSYLEKSGLVGLGVASETFFWDEIITPTWQEGSTTRRGYIDILTDRIAALCLPDKENSQGSQDIKKAVSLFMASYFDCCFMDAAWKNMLQFLHNDYPGHVVVATDHYAEATPTITRYMADWSINAIPLKEAARGTKNPLIIANSADIGFHKIDCRFWQTLQGQLFPPGHAVKVLLLDDFGANEAIGDHYGNHARVTIQEEKTRQALEKVFGKSVDVYPFVLKFPRNYRPNLKEKRERYYSLVENALSYVQGFINQ